MTERILFEIYKDTDNLFLPSDREKIKEKFPNINFTKLYTNIVNYQIKKYGTQLTKQMKHISQELALW